MELVSSGVPLNEDLTVFCGLVEALLPSFIVALFWAAAIFNRLVLYTLPFHYAGKIGCGVGKHEFAMILIFPLNCTKILFTTTHTYMLCGRLKSVYCCGPVLIPGECFLPIMAANSSSWLTLTLSFSPQKQRTSYVDEQNL